MRTALRVFLIVVLSPVWLVTLALALPVMVGIILWDSASERDIFGKYDEWVEKAFTSPRHIAWRLIPVDPRKAELELLASVDLGDEEETPSNTSAYPSDELSRALESLRKMNRRP